MPNILRGVSAVSPYVLEDVEARAREILESARREAGDTAARLLEEARREAARIREEAEKAGREAGFAAGKAEGEARGLEEGRRAALAQVAPAWEEAHKAVVEAAERLRASVAEVTTRAEEKVTDLAFKVGVMVLKREIEIDPLAFKGSLAAALQAAARVGAFRVRLNPEDLKTLQDGFETFKPLLPAEAGVEWVPDETVARGGAFVESAAGDVDALLSTQLAQIENAIWGRAGGRR